MTTKLTITMNDKVIEGAKTYAQKKGKSLSHLVENYLKSIAANDVPVASLSQKVTKLMGVIQLPDGYDYKKELASSILKKHGK